LNAVLNVFNVQSYSLHDGPGIRTVVFLKGCPLRCRWCCNPESQDAEREIFYTQKDCIGKTACAFCESACSPGALSFEENRAVLNREKCVRCFACAEVCPTNALRIVGKNMSVTEILDRVEQEEAFYRHGEGGLTVSGGEPLLHGTALVELLRSAKARHIHTAMETCGFADYAVLRDAAANLDYLLYDIKSLDEQAHKAYTGVSNRLVIENFSRLCAELPKLPKLVRTPVIPGFNDAPEQLAQIKAFISEKPNVSHEELPYHRFGEWKYAALGREEILSMPCGHVTPRPD
jgi:pyruvate formate lyase activating enzyme